MEGRLLINLLGTPTDKTYGSKAPSLLELCLYIVIRVRLVHCVCACTSCLFGDILFRYSLVCGEGSRRSISTFQLGCHLLMCAVKGAGLSEILYVEYYLEPRTYTNEGV